MSDIKTCTCPSGDGSLQATPPKSNTLWRLLTNGYDWDYVFSGHLSERDRSELETRAKGTWAAICTEANPRGAQAQPADAIQDPRAMAQWLLAMRSHLASSREASHAWDGEWGAKSWDNYSTLAAVCNAMAGMAPAEAVTRYCPGCGHVGLVDTQYRDCCPDGNQARMIPEALAKKCHDTFKLAITSVLDVQTALRDYHYALDTRQHGGVAADNAIKAIQRAFDMPWIQGQEAAARAATAGKGQTHG